MREDLLNEAESELALLRARNEREEFRRREQIAREQPEIYALVQEREALIFDTLRKFLKGPAESKDLPQKMDMLSAAIRDKLQKKGFPADYLAPVYRCPICQDTGRVGDPVREPCVCLKKAYQQKLREKIGLGNQQPETFERFDLSIFPNEKAPGQIFSQRDLMTVIRDDCKAWADSYPKQQSRDILLSGKSGLGKTFLLHAMAERLIERDVNVLIISAYMMLDLLRRSYFDHEESPSDLLDTDVLMIDDLGSEPLIQNVTIEQLFNLLNERQNRGRSTVISTNLNLVEFRQRYTERVASRLTDSRNCMLIALTGKDIRKKT